MKYFMLSGRGMGGRGGSSDIAAWVQEHGTVVPTEEWQGTGGNSAADDGGLGDFGGFGGRGGSVTLYEVKL
ncbi:hypothetical protein [Paenibacillus alkalitolerans]|uniref:hypothetical protein n=1 Tax=Paenibacillus alkalitolerans TaxID=2799335 RepID=UPI001F37043A|nr:hypothetical protein [Paenibacillus alkalitolerans]